MDEVQTQNKLNRQDMIQSWLLYYKGEKQLTTAYMVGLQSLDDEEMLWAFQKSITEEKWMPRVSEVLAWIRSKRSMERPTNLGYLYRFWEAMEYLSAHLSDPDLLRSRAWLFLDNIGMWREKPCDDLVGWYYDAETAQWAREHIEAQGYVCSEPLEDRGRWYLRSAALVEAQA